MSHLCSRNISILFFSTVVLMRTVNAQSIDEWPAQKQIETGNFEKRFIGTYKSEPEELNNLYQGLVECEIENEKARRISGTSIESLESVYSKIPNMEVEIDIDVDKLDILSTIEGCVDLKEVNLDKLKNSAMTYYQIPSSFKAPVMVDAEYHTEQVMTMQVNGGDHVTETEYDMTLQSVYLYPQSPGHPEFSQEIYSMTDYRSDVINMHTYSIVFVQSDNADRKVTMSRTTTNDEVKNSITVQSKNDLGQTSLRIYGKDSLMTIIGGKMHGLMITENYLYLSDKAADPLSYSCYDAGEKIDIFKVTSDTDCMAVTEGQIGEQNVYMDSIYKMQRDNKKLMDDMKNKLAEAPKYEAPRSGASLVEEKRKEEQAAKKKQESHFNQLISKAKCDLANSNWAYTGSNCKKGAAHGKGSAEDRSGLEFIGTFDTGNRVKGEIHQNGEMIFSGELVDDKPSGGAICLFEGEYEECRFFRGKRIDVLYKIRKENVKNQEKMAQIQKGSRVTTAKTKGTSDYLVNALEKEGAQRAATFIFDKLF